MISLPTDSIEPFPDPRSNVWIPFTGLLLVVFLIVHLAGISLGLVAPDAFEHYATELHRQPWLPFAELALAAAFLSHPLLSLHQTIRWRRARGFVAGPLRSRREGRAERLTVLAARLSPWTGTLLLLFLVVHLLQLRWHRPPAGEEMTLLLTVLHIPWALGLYLVAGIAVFLHLLQGNESACRSLGLLHPGNRDRIRTAGRWLALLIGAGFTLVPLGLLRGAGSSLPFG